jgi:hypothetical protein
MAQRDDETTMEFMPSPEGLYNYDFNASINLRSKTEQAKTMLVTNVEQ